MERFDDDEATRALISIGEQEPLLDDFLPLKRMPLDKPKTVLSCYRSHKSALLNPEHNQLSPQPFNRTMRVSIQSTPQKLLQIRQKISQCRRAHAILQREMNQQKTLDIWGLPEIRAKSFKEDSSRNFLGRSAAINSRQNVRPQAYASKYSRIKRQSPMKESQYNSICYDQVIQKMGLKLRQKLL